MITHPEIAKLRGNRTAQLRARRRMELAVNEWREHLQMAGVEPDLERYARGADLDHCRALYSVVRSVSTARSLIETWQATFAHALQDEPLSEMPFRHRVRGSVATIQLLTCGKAALSLSTLGRGEDIEHRDKVVFTCRETHEIVVEGSATGARHKLSEDSHKTTFNSVETAWQAGDTIQNSPTSARSIEHIEASLLILQVSRAPDHPQAARGFSLPDGRLLQSAHGDERVSRKFMALGVLGALGEKRGLVEMAQVAHDISLNRDLRWEAVRQLLALDPPSGMRLLAELSAQANDPIRAPAETLTAQLVANHPQLGQFLMEAA